jgi:hypothetical protein
LRKGRLSGGGRGVAGWVRLGSWGNLIPCRKAVMHDALFWCIYTQIYRYNVDHHVLNYTKKEGAIRKGIHQRISPQQSFSCTAMKPFLRM